jgi:superfamily I DNA/RNA helicase
MSSKAPGGRSSKISCAFGTRRGLETRLSLDGEFDFLPGISVTCVADVKGLEFDYVIVPDASAERYPDTPESRRALYVTVTRAIHQVWLNSVDTWSPILPLQFAQFSELRSEAEPVSIQRR